MRFRTVFLSAATVSAFLLLAGCGGGGGGDGGNGGGGSTDTGGNSPSTPGTAPNSGQATCQSQPVVGGDLFVADKGPVRITLLANGGLTGGTFMFFFDSAFGFNFNNPQDKWVQDRPFAPTAPVGTSTVEDELLRPPSPDFVNGVPVPSTYPKGVPIELWLSLDDGNFPGPANVSSTASINKDLPHDPSHSASVVYRGDDTATVTFFAGVRGPAFTVGLTNVAGKASTCLR